MPEVSDIWIKLNYWFLGNRRDLKRWWVILLLALDIFLVVFVATNGVVTAITYKQVGSWIEDIQNSRVIAQDSYARITPQPLTNTGVETYVDENGNTLAVAVVTNPNQLWAAQEVRYLFVGPTGETAERSLVLVPQGSSVFMANSDVGPNPELKIVSINWKRVPAEKLPNVSLSFTQGVHNTVLIPNTSGTKAISQITTTLSNASLFSIREVKGVVLVRHGSTLVSAKQFFVDAVSSREERDITIQFSEALPQFDSIIFFSEIDIFDPNMLEV